MTVETAQHYKRPPFLVGRVANPVLMLLIRLGMSPRGAHVLWTRGRKSGEWRKTPVNPMDYQGARYLVAPRGDTHWARNMLADPHGVLQVGKRSTDIVVEVVPVEERAPILRAYLDRWSAETASHFGVNKDISVDELREIAHLHPVFRIQ